VSKSDENHDHFFKYIESVSSLKMDILKIAFEIVFRSKFSSNFGTVQSYAILNCGNDLSLSGMWAILLNKNRIEFSEVEKFTCL
jgi:hypothetical protein